MRFITPQPERLPAKAVERAYLAGMEGVPWLSRNSVSSGVLCFDRDTSDSGNLYIPWLVEGEGELMLSTASLMERAAPYHLPVELARGCLNRLRNQMAAWRTAGLHLSAALQPEHDKAMHCFHQAATSQENAAEAAALAQTAIEHALKAINVLAADYSGQVLNIRHKQLAKLNTLFGCEIGAKPMPEAESTAFLSAFNTAVVSPCWREIEENAGERDWAQIDTQIQWARNQNLKLCAGPLLRLDDASLPDWLALWEEDEEDLESYMLQYVEAAVTRYSGSVHIWHATAGMNLRSAVALTEEQKLRLTVAVIERVRSCDPKAPVIISFDQPWASYLSREPFDLSPLHFADALIRSDLGVAGIGLDLNLGYSPHGTLPRDLLAYSQLLDRWSALGLPLLLNMTAPSSAGPDPAAKSNAQVVEAVGGGVSPATQRAMLEKILPLLVSKQAVHGVLWSQRTDAQPHCFPHGGLFDTGKQPKPALEVFQKFREQHLT